MIYTPLHGYTPVLYSKTGVYRAIHYFLIFVVLKCIHNLCFEQKYEKYYNFSYHSDVAHGIEQHDVTQK